MRGMQTDIEDGIGVLQKIKNDLAAVLIDDALNRLLSEESNSSA